MFLKPRKSKNLQRCIFFADSDGKSTEKHLTSNDIKKDIGYKIVLDFGPYNQPEGGSGGLFGTWLGKYCLDHPFGLTYEDWRNVDKQKKDDVWNVIQVY